MNTKVITTLRMITRMSLRDRGRSIKTHETLEWKTLWSEPETSEDKETSKNYDERNRIANCPHKYSLKIERELNLNFQRRPRTTVLCKKTRLCPNKRRRREHFTNDDEGLSRRYEYFKNCIKIFTICSWNRWTLFRKLRLA